MGTVQPKAMSVSEMKAFLDGTLDLSLESNEEVLLLDKHKIDSFIHKCCSCGLLHEIIIERLVKNNRLQEGWSLRFKEVDEDELLEREIFDVRTMKRAP